MSLIGNYNPRMVTLARESRGLTQSELAAALELRQSTISKVEAGDLTITDDLAKAAARVLRYPVAFFSQTDVIYPFGASTFYHRKLQSAPATVLRRIEARVNIYRFHVVRLIRSTDLDLRCQFKRMDATEHRGRIEEIAGLVRAMWHLSKGPIPSVTRVIENAGGIVIRFPFGTTKMFGLSEWVPPAPPLFFLNDHPDISGDRDRLTLAHELAHIILHGLPNPNMEDEANRFAGEFLMPAKDIRAHLRSPVKLHTVARMKPYWKTSMAAMISRARELGIISENQFVYLRVQLQEKGYGQREPAELDIPKEQPTLMRDILQAHLRELGYTFGDLARLTNMDVSEFREYHHIHDEYSGLRVVTA